MHVALEFADERLDFETPDDRVVGVWRGPGAVPTGEVRGLVAAALERPLGFPPLRQAVVPGDRVVIAVEPDLPALGPVVEAVCAAVQAGGVERQGITVLASGPAPGGRPSGLPEGVAWAVHDPDDRAHIAYLASTEQGRRVYLSRQLTDADCVVPVGRLGYDRVLGYRGPWSVIFPGLSDAETQRAYRGLASDAAPDRRQVRPALAESSSVSWLLGSQFHVGLVDAAAGGLACPVVGGEAAVRAEGLVAVDAAWSYRVERRAELVVIGVGRPGAPTGMDELAAGLATATRLVQHGGKVVVLSRTAGPLGPAVRRLAEVENPHPTPADLRGLEGEADYGAARQLAAALARADVYLLSALPHEDVDDLQMIPLARPEEARKLVAASGSSLFVSQAELTRAEAAED